MPNSAKVNYTKLPTYEKRPTNAVQMLVNKKNMYTLRTILKGQCCEKSFQTETVGV